MIEIIYGISITLYSFNRVILSSFLSFLYLNIGSISILISIKAFIWISILVGNIIDIYILGLIAVLIYWLHNYWLYGIILWSFLVYLFLTRVELSLSVPFYLESISCLFQSLTLANRLSINLIAGSLLIALLSISIKLLIIYYLVIASIIWLFTLLVFSFEVFNSTIQLYIFNLLTIEYSIFSVLLNSVYSNLGCVTL